MRKRHAFIGIALLALSLFAFANVTSALAQAGSTGGTIGKTDKSISDHANEPKRARTKVKAHTTDSSQVRVNKFIGCYHDAASRDLSGDNSSGADMSAARCIKYADRLDLPTRAPSMVISAFVEIITGGKEQPTIAICRARASLKKNAVAGGPIACTAQSSLTGKHLLPTKSRYVG